MSLGVYIQVPFCQTKCTYCNFHTGVVSSARFGPYATAVQTEIREHRARLKGAGVELQESLAILPVDTVYFGGGTPSLLDPAHLHAMLAAIRETFRCSLREVTLEADPETVGHQPSTPQDAILGVKFVSQELFGFGNFGVPLGELLRS